jgi:fatty aldehyde-generating acyl-ACP reductase
MPKKKRKIISSTSSLIKDFFFHTFPVSFRREYGFIFLVHPRNNAVIFRKFPLLKHLPKSFIDFFSHNFFPVTVSRITGLSSSKTKKRIKGYVVSIPMTASQMLQNREQALKQINKAIIMAKRRGIKLIGLGGLTSSITRGGIDLVDKHPSVYITTGHAYTAHNVTANVFELIEKLGINKSHCKIAIVGSAGSIGATSAKIIAREGYPSLLLIDLVRKHDKVMELEKEIREINPDIKTEITDDMNRLLTADVIITATNTPDALILSKHLKTGAVVVDDAQPSDVSDEVIERDDVLVIEAGVVHTPEINSNFNFGLKNRNDNFCCLAEVLVLASEEWDSNYVINRATLNNVDHVKELGRGLLFTTGELQNRKELITPEKLEKIKYIISK